jgi:hypothetical protein
MAKAPIRCGIASNRRTDKHERCLTSKLSGTIVMTRLASGPDMAPAPSTVRVAVASHTNPIAALYCNCARTPARWRELSSYSTKEPASDRGGHSVVAKTVNRMDGLLAVGDDFIDD